MNIHSATAYLKYKWNAQNRHGVHSPFAYALVEDVIENKRKLQPSMLAIPWQHAPAPRYDLLLRRIITYYGYKNIQALPVPDVHTTQLRQYDVLLIDGSKPQLWQHLLYNNLTILTNESMMVLTNIHDTEEHSEAWHAICADRHVRMSIDLYGIGLLFFKREFKVQQHFVLKTQNS